MSAQVYGSGYQTESRSVGAVPPLLPLPLIGEHFLLESRRPRVYVLGDHIRDRCFHPRRLEKKVAAYTDEPGTGIYALEKREPSDAEIAG